MPFSAVLEVPVPGVETDADGHEPVRHLEHERALLDRLTARAFVPARRFHLSDRENLGMRVEYHRQQGRSAPPESGDVQKHAIVAAANHAFGLGVARLPTA